MMKIATLTVFLLAAVIPNMVLAASGSPHFVGSVTAKFLGNNVQVCWKEAGLGSNVNIDYLATANATATYVCVNEGGNCPQAANKTNITGPVATPGTFSSGQNGAINQCLTISPPSGATLTCPGGQTATLSDVSYTNIGITDTTNGVNKTATPSTLAKTIFVCPN
jgi:hypothetical protein